ncbi:EamA family transporter [Antribacter soli]|uniref:EamA family transporter n=1 Tax=Antribacter soli TaxID=2910976 RepID=UPI0035577EEF
MLLLPVALVAEGAPPAISVRGAVGYAWLGLIGTGAAYLAWTYGACRLGPATLAYLAPVSPLVAAALGWVVLGEGLTPLGLAGLGVAVAATATGGGLGATERRRGPTDPTRTRREPRRTRPRTRRRTLREA